MRRQAIDNNALKSHLTRRRKRILVVFSDATDLWWLRLLKPGFRHCFAILFDDAQWVVIDPLSHRLEIATGSHIGISEIAEWYLDQGCQVVETTSESVPPRTPFPEPLTCVTVVKRLIGVRGQLIWTPWQLFRALVR